MLDGDKVVLDGDKVVLDGNAICSNMDEPRVDHTKWSKPDRERQISHNIAYMWNQKKMIEMNLYTKQK